MISRKPRIAVVFGGRSGEHAVSCVTAAGVLGAIDRERYDVVALGITKAGRWVLVDCDPNSWRIQDGSLPSIPTGAKTTATLVSAHPGEGSAAVTELLLLQDDGVTTSGGIVDVVFPLIHGPFGEDGTLQGLLEMAGVPYVGSGVLSSAIGMDKHYMKVALAAAGFEIGPYVAFRIAEYEASRAEIVSRIEQLRLPIFVKPARAGSSLGITRVTDLKQLDAALYAAASHDPKIVVEEGIAGREIECAVLQGRAGAPRTALPAEILVTNSEHTFYDFEAKYLAEEAVNLSCPAALSPEIIAAVQAAAARAFTALDCEGLARADFFVTPDERVIINEINTMPGFTPHSMYPRMWEASGMNYHDLVNELLELAMDRPSGLR